MSTKHTSGINLLSPVECIRSHKRKSNSEKKDWWNTLSKIKTDAPSAYNHIRNFQGVTGKVSKYVPLFSHDERIPHYMLPSFYLCEILSIGERSNKWKKIFVSGVGKLQDCRILYRHFAIHLRCAKIHVHGRYAKGFGCCVPVETEDGCHAILMAILVVYILMNGQPG